MFLPPACLYCRLLCIPEHRHRCTYMRYRHKLVFSQRMLRMVHLVVAACQSSEGLQAALARALDAGKAAAAVTPTLRVAVLNLTRPLFVAPVITMGHVSSHSAAVVPSRNSRLHVAPEMLASPAPPLSSSAACATLTQ